jgi:hypothetical protein
MIFMTPRTNFHQSGFALLLTIVVISIVLAVGISLLQITVKQISLSTTGRDSEVAFHGAQGMVECAQMFVETVDFISSGAGDSIAANCFGQSSSANESVNGTGSFNANTYGYTLQFDWSNSEDALCAEADIYILDARGGGYTETFTNQGLGEETCDNGDVCTVVFARGYNRECAEVGSLRTVQRELTISY